MAEFKKLFEPLRIGEMEIKNRIALPPMACGYAALDGYVTDRFIDYYVERAKGGCALIVIESSYPRPEGYPFRPNLSDDKFLPGLSRLAKAIHDAGAKAGIQLLPHKGRTDLVDPATASETVSPKTGAKVRALTIDDIEKLRFQVGDATRRVKEAGFDCIQLHGGSGYLISEFLSPRINRRTDKYGGNARKRAQLALDLIAAAKEKAGLDYPVIYRMTADERVGKEGFGVEGAVYLAKLLEEAGADAIDAVSGNVENYCWVIPYMYMPDGCNTYLSAAIKKAVKIPVGVAGKIRDPYLAERILEEGQADFIDMGRALIVDPYLPAKALAGKTRDIRKCFACLRCIESILSASDYKPSGAMLCSMNPALGREKEFAAALKPAARKKKVLVIGGGPGGMEAAIVAAQRGHKVTLWEKEDKLGGLLNLAVVPPGKEDLKSAIEYSVQKLRELKVDVKLSKKVTAKAVQEFAPDTVIVATGSTPLIPRIKGMGKRKIATFSDVLSGKVDTGKKVVVVGGGFVGCELADYLAEKGKKVTIVEILPELASELFPAVADVIVQRLKESGVQAYTCVKDEEITGKGIDIVDKDGRKVSMEADDVVIAAGSTADRGLIEALKGKVSELYEVGDCVKARRVQEAVYEGANAGLAV